jgi:TfoX/Sxy family transcriptional regulator of competence genes
MVYDEQLAARVRAMVSDAGGVTEQRMFGGLAFLVGGHMAVAASGQGGLLVRVDPVAGEELVDGGDVVPMEMRGRAMTGWLRVATDAVADDDALRAWVDRGVAHVRTLPPKR